MEIVLWFVQLVKLCIEFKVNGQDVQYVECEVYVEHAQYIECLLCAQYV